jgi:RND family efflux transporter MFP subunit
MRRGTKTGIWILVALVIVAVFAFTATRRLQRSEVQSIESIQAAEGIPVDIVVARTIPIEDWREFVGMAEGYHQVNLASGSRSRVNAVHVSVGTEVPAGKVLISLDDYDPSRAGLSRRTALSQYETVRVDSLRMEKLFLSGAISQQELDHVRAQAEAAHALYLTARRAVELDTPVAGMVTAVNIEAGDYAEEKQTLVTVSAYDRIRIPLELSEAERTVVKVGQMVRLRAGETTLNGKVSRVALSADSHTRLFPAELIVENPDHLIRPGSLVTPEILIGATDDHPAIPPVGLIRGRGENRVFVAVERGDGDYAEVREVSQRLSNGVLVAITGDLQPGERVVVWGQNKLKDGVKVRINRDLTTESYPPGH